MTRFRAILAYDGTAYQGFQRQREGIPTVQAAIERTISDVTGCVVGVVAAGRTDTGVHARGQVIAFDVDWTHTDDDLLRALNARLPDDIALQDLCQQAGFHPRFDAKSRWYRYTVLHASQRDPLTINSSWQVRHDIDFDAMQAAGRILIGVHDFAAFGRPPQGDNTVREVFHSGWSRQGDCYTYDIEATAFLHHMVRRIVGGLVDVGRGWLSLDEFRVILTGKDISLAKTMAPPQGLVLHCVNYSEANIGCSRLHSLASAARRTEGHDQHETEDICNNPNRY